MGSHDLEESSMTATTACSPGLPRVDSVRQRQALLRPVVLLTVMATGVLAAGSALGAVIPVTSLSQKISSSNGCSLQEAIFSANFDNNVAIAGYSGTTPNVVVTQCVAGSGDDIIVLPAAAVMQLSDAVGDAYNAAGPTATPIITSTITILGYGATLERIGSRNFRLFTVGATGRLTIRKTYIRGFRAQGGNGSDGGGGGLGAGGAIFVSGGVLVIEASTFQGNVAYGGQGGVGNGGGGGGIGGNGSACFTDGGGGGGGARGNGAPTCPQPKGSGGGGTVSSGSLTQAGFDCGGNGGFASDGQDAPCAGGGGGGAGDTLFRFPGEDGWDGGRGAYGGGGGGGTANGEGGHGGFGGGGGASGLGGIVVGEDGGNGGFGGGGGAGANGGIFDGDPGNGGFFAGSGSSNGGGGGGGLGGAIFNESGVVDIRNSTFTGNSVNGGFSEKTQDGTGGGGAIFSVNGRLTVLNSTISGNTANFGGGIIVAQDSENAPTSFVLENTIVAGNGQYECAMTGFSIGVAFVGNLIQNNVIDGTTFYRETFAGCQGVVTSADPQLGPLQYNDGPTPTMAIATGSPAWNAADPGTSLTVDQRKQDRPAMGGFDIGAFELCIEGFGRLQRPCPILAGIDDSGAVIPTVQLTIVVQPQGGGTTTPAPGTRDVVQDSVVPLSAIPNTGYQFTGWSGNVANPLDRSTTVFMNTSQTVIANFAPCHCATDVTGAVVISYGSITPHATTGGRSVQTVTVTNISATTIKGPISLVLDQLTAGVTLYKPTGYTSVTLPAGSPYLSAAVNLAPGQSTSFQLQFTNPGNVGFSYQARVLAGTGPR
jgi:Divergent InlB B-repeat domain